MRYLILLLITLTFQLNYCFADTVILKNQHSINGIISEENEESIVLNVGCGTITLPRSDIESVQRAEDTANELMVEDWKRQYFESFPAPTPKDQVLLDGFKELRGERGQLTRSTTRKENISKEISILQREISQIQDELHSLGKRIKSTDSKKNITAYNALVVEFNLKNSELREAVNVLNDLQRNYAAVNDEATGYITRYRHFEEGFKKKYEESLNPESSAEQKVFYQQLKERLDELRIGIRDEEVGFTKLRNSIIISALLNGSVETAMVVDTGASLTIISEDVAKRLGIYPEELKQDIELALADGRRIKAKFIMLDSVRIGNAEAKSVEAAIIKDKPSNESDGLLGMSFLKNFSFSIDAEEQKLIFSSFE